MYSKTEQKNKKAYIMQQYYNMLVFIVTVLQKVASEYLWLIAEDVSPFQTIWQ